MNHSSSNTATYVFAPVSLPIKIALATGNGLCGLYGFVANSLILYFISTQKCPLRRGILSSRQKIINRFIQSLALSDVLCSLFSVPLFTVEMLVDYIQTDFACKAVRAVTMSFAVVSVMNYIVIGIERYMSVFHPFIVPSTSMCRRFVVAAWIVGFLLELLVLPSYNRVRFDLDDGTYTRVCKYDNSIATYRGLFFAFTVIGYIIPCIFLSFTTISITRFLRRMKRVGRTESSNPEAEGSNSNKKHKVDRFKLTRMFVMLIVTFITPYIVFIIYSFVLMVFKPKITFTFDYISRHVYSLLVFSNGAISSSILFYNSKYLKNRLIRLCRSVIDSSDS